MKKHINNKGLFFFWFIYITELNSELSAFAKKTLSTDKMAQQYQSYVIINVIENMRISASRLKPCIQIKILWNSLA